jgi:hypothetical protein
MMKNKTFAIVYELLEEVETFETKFLNLKHKVQLADFLTLQIA